MTGVEGVQISYLGGGVPLPPYPPQKTLKIEKNHEILKKFMKILDNR